MVFNFKSLIKRYGVAPVELITYEGHYDFENSGDYIKDLEAIKLIEPAAVVPIPKDELTTSDGGYYDHDSRKLYCYEGLATDDIVKYQERLYKVTGEQDYSDYDENLKIYYIERVRSDERDGFN